MNPVVEHFIQTPLLPRMGGGMLIPYSGPLVSDLIGLKLTRASRFLKEL